jgi:hypothetical protein
VPGADNTIPDAIDRNIEDQQCGAGRGDAAAGITPLANGTS